MTAEPVTITLADGRRVDFAMRPGPDRPPAFVLGFRKSGSSLLNMLCTELQRLNGWPALDLGGTMFRHNIAVPEWIDDPAWLPLIARGQMVHGLRVMPPLLLALPLFADAPKVLMVRDPRDALVSQYFSAAWSHAIPVDAGREGRVAQHLLAEREQAQSVPIDRFVRDHVASFAAQMQLYNGVLGTPRLLVLRYEDWIFRKDALIRRLSRHFDLPVADAVIAQMLGWADRRPVHENPRDFVRRVAPGDHLGKLRRETIEALNAELRPVLATYGYRDHADAAGGAA